MGGGGKGEKKMRDEAKQTKKPLFDQMNGRQRRKIEKLWATWHEK